MLEIKYNNKSILFLENVLSIAEVKTNITNKIQHEDFYLIHNGKHFNDDGVPDGIVHVVPKLVGGKGGFGSMLRAIGAQIEKTTNREACRDLSGRRLRDINEEKRLKAWIDKQATREQEAEDKKQKKLERLVQKPKVEFKDDTYDKERSELPERLEDAVTQGMEAAASASASTSSKRKSDTKGDEVKKKKRKVAMWLDDDIDISSSDDNSASESEDSSEETKEVTKLAATN
ncbi:splicing regulator SDE2-like [Atheta coriaria]|uniref:splicing regulator SDE2-like n=1 Tax=Dalotia coriaria TaxID=877792 RepID=UPI0031F3A41C